MSDKELTLKIVKNPSWAFVTEGGKKSVSFSKDHPQVVEGMFREVSQMLFHLRGANEAQKFTDEVTKNYFDFYKNIKP